MYSLLLDSSSKYLTVGLAKDNVLIEDINYECFQQQSEKMIPEIDRILKKHSINPKEINEIIVGKGPGSYTGVRIALTIAKVYAFALKINCYAVSTLKMMQDLSCPSICLLNARSARSYIGVYDKNKAIIEDTIYTNDQVLYYIKNHPTYRVCGDTEYLGIDGYKASLNLNLISLKDDCDLVKDIMSLKAVYLKD